MHLVDWGRPRGTNDPGGAAAGCGSMRVAATRGAGSVSLLEVAFDAGGSTDAVDGLARPAGDLSGDRPLGPPPSPSRLHHPGREVDRRVGRARARLRDGRLGAAGLAGGPPV